MSGIHHLCFLPGVLWFHAIHSSLIYFVLIFVWYKIVVQFYSFACRFLVFPTLSIRVTALSTQYFLLLCHRLIDHKNVGLFLGSLFCSIDLHICFYIVLFTIALQYSLKSGSMILPVLFFAQVPLAFQGLCGSIQIQDYSFYFHEKYYQDFDKNCTECVNCFG